MSISPGTITVWLGLPAEGDGSAYRRWLPPEELARANRIRVEEPRNAYMASRALLRLVASAGTVGTRFERRCPRCGQADHGRPVLVGDDRQFSLSRTRGLVAVAVADQPIGVDVEQTSRGIPSHASVFSAVEQAWLADPATGPLERTRLWCAKEALGKLSGLGLLDGSRVAVAGPIGPTWSAATDNLGQPGVVRAVDGPDPFVGAVAARTPALVVVADAAELGPFRPVPASGSATAGEPAAYLVEPQSVEPQSVEPQSVERQSGGATDR